MVTMKKSRKRGDHHGDVTNEHGFNEFQYKLEGGEPNPIHDGEPQWESITLIL